MPSENLERLIAAVLVTLLEPDATDEDAINDLATRLRAVFPVSDDEYKSAIKRLHAKLAIRMDLGTRIVGGTYAPWLLAKRASIVPFYWDRFDRFLTKESRWPGQVIKSLGRVADEILDLLHDPTVASGWARRGLVIGDVQSGKTATYTSLCCKAADAGYKLVILLTGTLESLRRQTQERLDEGFVGLDSSGVLAHARNHRRVGVGVIDGSRSAGVFTSREKDFSKSLVNALGFRLAIFKEPVLVVVKKNKTILGNLEKWLADFNANHEGKIDVPLLLIDDEADSASINTNAPDSDPTAINTRIRALLKLFTRSSYLGFTATPFANIFIDPDSKDEMLGDDLFPRDFIYVLDAPTNHIGPAQIFGEQQPFGIDMIRTIDDAHAQLPPRHKSDLNLETLPVSLKEAVSTFLLTNAIRDLRGDSNSHRSMLVNVSRFTAVQDQAAALIYDRLSAMQQDIRNYSQLSPEKALANPTVVEIKAVWQKEFAKIEPDWGRVQKALLNAALPVTVKAVNQRTGAATLDYASYKATGLRVIAVGGNSLSRGLTLEGLSTSYFFRDSQMYDTLLQMGRWFGYRDGYHDLCRLWITPEAESWYSHITAATAELREEVREMRKQNATPMEFGLKVREKPDSLIPTAHNKMRQASTLTREISLSGQMIETARLWADVNVVQSNYIALTRFVASMERAGVKFEKSPWAKPICYSVPKGLISTLLGDFKVHPYSITFQAAAVGSYVRSTTKPQLQTWDVVFATGSGEPTRLGPVRITTEKRRVDIADGALRISAGKARVGSRGVEREGLDPAVARQLEDAYHAENPDKSIPDKCYRLARSRPLLIVNVIRTDPAIPALGPDPIVALGLSFPRFDDSDIASRVQYRINLVELRSLRENEQDDDIPDEA